VCSSDLTTSLWTLIAGLALTATASAQPFYALIEGGSGTADLSRSTFDAAVNTWLQHPEATSGKAFDNTSGGIFRIGAGYQLSDRFAIETLYEQLGSYHAGMTLTGQNSSGDTAQTHLKEEASVKGLGVRLMGNYPISQNFSLLAGAGLSYLQQERQNNVSQHNYGQPTRTGSSSESLGQISPSLGLGVEVTLTKEVRLRGWYQRYMNAVSTETISNAHLDSFNGGLVIHW
jgi:opacity protein-like surface antigen